MPSKVKSRDSAFRQSRSLSFKNTHPAGGTRIGAAPVKTICNRISFDHPAFVQDRISVTDPGPAGHSLEGAASVFHDKRPGNEIPECIMNIIRWHTSCDLIDVSYCHEPYPIDLQIIKCGGVWLWQVKFCPYRFEAACGSVSSSRNQDRRARGFLTARARVVETTDFSVKPVLKVRRSSAWTLTVIPVAAWGIGAAELDGVHSFNPDGKLIGRVNLPERCASLCFFGVNRNRLFMACGRGFYGLTSTLRA